MPRPSGSARRLIQGLSLGDVQSLRAREARNEDMGFREVELQFQVPMDGTANTGVAMAQVEIDFMAEDVATPLHYAPSQRDSDFDRPQFWFGGETYSGDRDDVGAWIMATACVTAWDVNAANGQIEGATVNIAVLAGEETAFFGIMHLTFQGYGAVSEAETGTDLGV